MMTTIQTTELVTFLHRLHAERFEPGSVVHHVKRAFPNVTNDEVRRATRIFRLEQELAELGAKPYADDPLIGQMTPAMVEAGKLELARWNPDLECPDTAVENIFTAMASAKRTHRGNSP